MQGPEGLGDMDAARLRAEGKFAAEDTRVEDTPGARTWPVPAPVPVIPPVGLNWQTVAERLGADPTILRHEGQIVLAGEYFPAAGFYIDPETFRAQHVDVGDICLRHGYLLGDLSAREFAEWFELMAEGAQQGGRIVLKAETAPILGLFADETAANRARTAILQGAIGAGVRVEPGPGGILLRVARSSQPGKAATLIAANAGAVIAIAGEQVNVASPTTAPSLPAAQADSWRPGTGAAADSEAPSYRGGSSDEFPPPPTG